MNLQRACKYNVKITKLLKYYLFYLFMLKWSESYIWNVSMVNMISKENANASPTFGVRVVACLIHGGGTGSGMKISVSGSSLSGVGGLRVQPSSKHFCDDNWKLIVFICLATGKYVFRQWIIQIFLLFVIIYFTIKL